MARRNAEKKQLEIRVFSSKRVSETNAALRAKGSTLREEVGSSTSRRTRAEKRLRSPSADRRQQVSGHSSVPAHVRRQALKRQRARKRQRKHTRRLRAAFGEMGVLETGSVKDPQRRDYVRRLEKFWEFVQRFSLPHKRLEELDRCLVDHCDWLYLDGEGSDAGTKLKAAFEAYHIEYLRGNKLVLPRFARSLKGWKKMAPMATRRTLPEALVYALAGWMLANRHSSKVLMVITMLSG